MSTLTLFSGSTDDDNNNLCEIYVSNNTENFELEEKLLNNEFEKEFNGDNFSILTRLTLISSEENNVYEQFHCFPEYDLSRSEIFENDASNFPPPDINRRNYDEISDIKEDKILDNCKKYLDECYKYSLPPISIVKNILNGKSTNLDLKYYIPQSIGISLAFDAFNESKSCLIDIDLSNSPFTKTGCYSLGQFIRNSTTLKSLNLANCKVGVEGFKVLNEAFQNMKNLIDLNVSGCNMTDENAIILANSLSNCKTCKILNLSRNGLYKSQSGVAIGKMLSLNNTLEMLELGWNTLYEEKCIQSIFGGVMKNKSLIKLGLSWNSIQPSEALSDAMDKAFKKNSTLQILDLQNNRLIKCDEELPDALTKSISLKEIYLGGNPLNPSDYFLFVKMTEKCKELIVLDFGNFTYITKDVSKLIDQILKKNLKLKITYKGTILSDDPTPVDIRPILMDRLKFLAMKPKKVKFQKNVGHLFQQFQNDNLTISSRTEFLEGCTLFGAVIPIELYEQIATAWMNKRKRINVADMCEYYLLRHPTEPQI